MSNSKTHGIIKPKIKVFNALNQVRGNLGMQWDEYLLYSIPLMKKKFESIRESAVKEAERSLQEHNTNGKELSQQQSEVA